MFTIERISHRSHHLLAASLAVVLPVFLPAGGSAAQIDVGVGTGCEASTLNIAIQMAIGAGADEIRLSKTISYTDQNLPALVNFDNVGSGPLTFSGGWDTCTSAIANAPTVVDGIGTSAVFAVEATAGRTSIVNFVGLEIIGGSRGISASGNSDVHILRSRIRGNSGGLLATTGANIDIDFSSVIDQNGSPLFGGGINCSDAGSEILLSGLVWGNSSTSAGGGIFAQNNCHVALREGAYVFDNSSPVGAGLHVQGGALVDGGGTGAAGVRVYDNHASNEGGGFRVVGATSLVALGNTRVYDNSAVNRGGGVSVGNGGTFHLERFNFEVCVAPPRCATLNGNFLTSGGNGSAVYAGIGGHFRMYQGFIEKNSGPAEAGFVIYAEDSPSTIHIEGVQIWDNRTVSIFEGQNSAGIVAGFVSAARNNYLVGGGPTRLDSLGAQASSSANIQISSSILIDQRPFVTATGGTIAGDCLLLDTASGLTSNTGAPMVGVDPLFRNPDTGNLRLRLASPAIDACDSTFSPSDSDYDVDDRGWDLPSKPNLLGPFDRGADEIRPLFANGFESGNTSAWSTTVP